MFKILILAYLIGFDPVSTQQTFQMLGWYRTMDECKAELLKKNDDNTYAVMKEFVIDGGVKWDWLVAGCKNDETREEFRVLPDYPLGKPEELEGVTLDLDDIDI